MSAGLRGPVVAAWGAGTNSTAMIIELVRRGESKRPGSTVDPVCQLLSIVKI
ncbi:hypothetical protein [Novosphingobium sp. KA1]|uniref:hypothetical protein n=1 Tax=Novosphingobium sp. (strain KA1) TaxID=164608 RepID=UPI001A8CFA1F|nr:hypothetical protein [Novosphingobium sp. KA1]